jgi:hypothetical protein
MAEPRTNLEQNNKYEIFEKEIIMPMGTANKHLNCTCCHVPTPDNGTWVLGILNQDYQLTICDADVAGTHSKSKSNVLQRWRT